MLQPIRHGPCLFIKRSGSAGHKLNEVGTGLDEALAIAKDVGIKSISTYEKRVPTKYKI